MAGMQEAPDHRADLVEEPQGIAGLIPIDGTGRAEQTQVAVDLLGRSVGDSPQMCRVATAHTSGGSPTGRPGKLTAT